MLLLLLVACGPPSAPLPVDLPGETGGPVVPDGSAAAFFSTDRVHTVDIELDPADIRALDADPKTYVEGVATLDGARFERVGVRVKGSSTLQTFAGKPSLKIDLNRFVDQDLDGLELVQLHGLVIDTSQLHEALGWRVAADLGLPHSRVAYARVTVNGEDYGLYAHVEAHDDEWMKRTFADAEDGRLYEGGYPGWPESYDHAELMPGQARYFDLEEGEDVGHEDLRAAIDTIHDVTSPDWNGRVSEHVDLDAFVRFVAAEAWIGQWDGYAYAANNFRVYVGADGRAQLLLSGLDWSFTEGGEWTRPTAALARMCREDATCAQALDRAVIEVCEELDGDALVAERERLWRLIEDDVASDPRRPIHLSVVASEQALLDQWLRDRSEILATLWAGGRPEDGARRDP